MILSLSVTKASTLMGHRFNVMNELAHVEQHRKATLSSAKGMTESVINVTSKWQEEESLDHRFAAELTNVSTMFPLDAYRDATVLAADDEGMPSRFEDFHDLMVVVHLFSDFEAKDLARNIIYACFTSDFVKEVDFKKGYDE